MTIDQRRSRVNRDAVSRSETSRSKAGRRSRTAGSSKGGVQVGPAIGPAVPPRSGAIAPEVPGVVALRYLNRAAIALRQHVERTVLRRVNLTWTGLAVLRLVVAQGRVETRVVAVETGIAKATLTGVVDTLVARDLVRRRRHPHDGRLVLLEPTRAGRGLVRRILPAVLAEEAYALRGLSNRQLQQFGGVLAQIVQHLEAAPSDPRRR
jgi:DNA-binding MarR family transcriptional regulator